MTPQQANEPSTCPFCDTTPIIDGKDEYLRIRCETCGVQGPAFDFNQESDEEIAQAERDAIAAWNRRAPAPTEPAVDRDAVLELAATTCDCLVKNRRAVYARDCAEAIRALKLATPASPAVCPVCEKGSLVAHQMHWCNHCGLDITTADDAAKNANAMPTVAPASPAVPGKMLLTESQMRAIAKVIARRVAKNASVAPELCFAPALFALQDSFGITAAPAVPEPAPLAPSERLFRKKPVTVEAIQWTGKLSCLDPFFIPELHQAFCSDKVGIPTLEGTMIASVGDWIIKGVKGEFYPCKPDVFAMTYEQASQPTAPMRLICQLASLKSRTPEAVGLLVDEAKKIMAQPTSAEGKDSERLEGDAL